MPPEEESMRDTFEAAFEEVERETIADDDPKETPEETIEQSQAQEESPGDSDKTALELDPEKAQEKEKPAEAAVTESKIKAPASWKPAEREGWDKLPAHVQAAVDRREKEIAHNLQTTAQARRVAQEFNNIMQPYKPILDAEGVTDPFQAVNGLLQTAATLRVGSAQQKAQQIANLIQGYDVDIHTLDSLLAGTQPKENDLGSLIDQKLQPIVNQFQQQQDFQVQQRTQAAADSVQQFLAENEFAKDVSNDMADLLDMAAKRGQKMSIDEAYKKAIAMNPEISGIIAERDKANRLKEAAAQSESKKMAAASIAGTRSGAGPVDNGRGKSILDSINDAWDQFS